VRSDGKGSYEIVQGLELGDFLSPRIKASADELAGERKLVSDLIK